MKKRRPAAPSSKPPKTAEELLAHVLAAFCQVRRPPHFTNYQHCEECLEHDTLMRNRSLDTLTYADVGNPGWNPVCFLSPAAFRYWFPAFVRLCCLPCSGEESYLSEFLFFLGPYQGDSTMVAERAAVFDACQKRAVLTFLNWCAEHLADPLKKEMHDTEMHRCIRYWQRAVDTSGN